MWRGQHRRTEVAGATAIVLIAWLLRVWELGSLPPGLHHDEAIEGLNALAILSGQLRFWFPAGGGREPLFMYLAAGAVWALGPTALALRLLAAAASTLAVAASFALLRRIFDRRVALVASALMASSYWQVHTGRLGLRSALLAPLAALAFALLFRGLDRDRPLTAAAGGAALGLSVYSYFAARLLPLVALPVLAFELLGRRPAGSASPRWRPSAAFLAAAALVALPMALYALRAARANERVNEASILAQPDPGAALRESVLGALAMFALRGDEMWKYNLAARPLFSPPLAVAFLFGLALCLLTLRQRGARTALIWLVAMTLPSALATESPHFIRISGIAPVLFALPALPLARLGARWPRLAPLGLALLLAATSGLTWRDYFLTWGRSPETGPAFAYDMAAAAAMLRQLPADEPAYLSVDPYEPRQFVVEYLAWPRKPRWYDARRGLVLPPSPSLQLFPSSARPPAGWLERVGGAEPLLRGELVEAYRIAPPRLEAAPIARLGDDLELLRAEPPGAVRSDESATVLLAWRLRRGLAEDLTAFVHVEDERGGWGGRDDRFYLTGNREAGETVVAAFQVPLEPGTPPGQYRLEAGVYGRDGARLRTRDGRDHQDLGRLVVQAAGRPWVGPDPPGAERAAELAGGLRLRGATLAPRQPRPGERLTATTYWQRTGRGGPGCELALGLRSGAPSAADAVTRLAREPLGGGFPPAEWALGELVQQRTSLTVPAEAAGAAEVELSACGGAPISLGQVRVVGVSRQTERPTPPVAREARFGQAVRLIGYGVEGELRPGATLALTLFWAADGATERPLTVFSHLLDAAERVVGQHDGAPVDGSRPTTGWRPGEYLTDRHELRLDPGLVPGEYALEVGLYDPATGARAPVFDPAGRPLGDRLILEHRRTLGA
ncbi:MAG TPA: glycosyltransferase family 39 protein [Chloroflexota bacterium]